MTEQSECLAAGNGLDGLVLNGTPDWWLLALTLVGGLALFLFGIDQMSAGLRSATGTRLKSLLVRFTSNRFKGLFSGSIVTAILQSSSVTTVLLVGFVASGLMTLRQSVSVIMGANIGKTVTVQVIAFDIGKTSLALIALGFGLRLLNSRDRIRQSGTFLLGVGLIFYGMHVMGEGMRPLRSYGPFIELLAHLRDPLMGVLVGAVFTALVQASSATIGIAIVLASQGLLDLQAGIAIALGANIGTCMTALLATIGRNREALRVAIVHILFNLIGAIAWFAFIPELATLATQVSPQSADLAGIVRTAAEVPRQLANAHAFFNLANALLMLPFVGPLAWLAQRLVPERPEVPLIETKYLDEQALRIPSIALQNARMETARLVDLAKALLDKVPDAITRGESAHLDRMQKDDDRADLIQAAIIRYLGKIRKLDLSDEESDAFRNIIAATDSLERINDTLSGDIVEICRKKSAKQLHASATMKEMLTRLYRTLHLTLDDTLRLLRDEDPTAASAILKRKDNVKTLIDEIHQHQEQRFGEVSEDRLGVFRMEMDLVEKLHRVYSLAKRIAHAFEGGPAPRRGVR